MAENESLLSSDRQQYSWGKLVSKFLGKGLSQLRKSTKYNSEEGSISDRINTFQIGDVDDIDLAKLTDDEAAYIERWQIGDIDDEDIFKLDLADKLEKEERLIPDLLAKRKIARLEDEFRNLSNLEKEAFLKEHNLRIKVSGTGEIKLVKDIETDPTLPPTSAEIRKAATEIREGAIEELPVSELRQMEEIKIKNSPAYIKNKKFLTTDFADGAGVTFPRKELQSIEENEGAEFLQEAMNDWIPFKFKQDEYANMLIESGIESKSVARRLNRNIPDDELTEGEKSIRLKFEKWLEDPDSPILIEHREGREPRQTGGLLDDKRKLHKEGGLTMPIDNQQDQSLLASDRQQYSIGSVVSKLLRKGVSRLRGAKVKSDKELQMQKEQLLLLNEDLKTAGFTSTNAQMFLKNFAKNAGFSNEALASSALHEPKIKLGHTQLLDEDRKKWLKFEFGEKNLTPLEIVIARELYPKTAKSSGFQGSTLNDLQEYLDGDINKLTYFVEQVRDVREEVAGATLGTLRKQEDAMLRVDPDIDVENLPYRRLDEGALRGDIDPFVPDPYRDEVTNVLEQLEEEAARRLELGEEEFEALPDNFFSDVFEKLKIKKAKGGLLSSDRQQYQEAGPVMPLPEETEEPIVSEPIIASEEAVPPEEGAVPPEEGKVVPDEQMEDEYLDFVVSQSLDEEEETYLMDTLEADPKLSIIFDKIMDTATEFAGSGPVDGPGTEVSDSIPARLSDGEFVMTAKAADEIGPDNLQGMMSDAELKADQRQAAQEGGLIQPDFEDEIDELGRPINQEIRKGMLGVNPRLQPTR